LKKKEDDENNETDTKKKETLKKEIEEIKKKIEAKEKEIKKIKEKSDYTMYYLIGGIGLLAIVGIGYYLVQDSKSNKRRK
jgi:F0F1-type ATP synthase assembly protein I